MEVRDLIIDAEATVGDGLLLVDILPVFVYENGKRTDNISGYRYVVVMPTRAFDRLSVKIAGEKQLDLLGDEYPVVEFDGLEIKVLWTPDGYRPFAQAAAIREVE